LGGILDHRQTIWTVLVVEDEWLLRADIVSYLRAAGWRVIEASDGETALALVEDGAPVDVLFTDIALGGRVNGWELGEKLRALRPASGVIYASGRYAEPRRPVAGSVALEKPYSRDDVLLACNGICGNGHPERVN
jgi:CheY-like chemotaxis protein